MIVKKHRLILLAAGIVTLLAAAPAFAATRTWTGAAGNNSWNISGNWNPVVQPAINGTVEIIFGATSRQTPDLTLPWNVVSVTFNNTAGPYNLFSRPKGKNLSRRAHESHMTAAQSTHREAH